MTAGRAVGYIRQSVTRDEDSLSLELQERLIRELAAHKSLAIVEVFPDPDRRGWDDDRPGLKAALARCAQGDIGAFIVYDMSRLARSLRLQEQYVHRLSELGIDLYSVREPHVSTPLFRQLLGAFAEEQGRVISANWRNVLAGRARRGLGHGIIPYGYQRGERGGPWVVVQNEAAIIHSLFRQYADGATIVDLATDLTRRGVPTPRGHDWWRPETVSHILDNPTYAGVVVLNGERYDGAHPAIIDENSYATVAARRAVAYRPPRKKLCASWLEGHIFHACGARMHLNCSPATKPGERPRFRCWSLTHPARAAVRCAAPRPTIAAYLAEPAVRTQLARDLAALIPVRSVIAAARELARRQTPGTEDARKRLDADAARVAESSRRAEDLYLSGVRDRSWFDAQEATHGAERLRIEREIAVLPKTSNVDELRAHGASLRELAPLIARAADDRMADVLAELGIVVVGSEGVRVLYYARYAAHMAHDEGEIAERFLGD